MQRLSAAPRPPLRNRSARQCGVTLIELMVALVIGLVIVVALSTVFVSSSASRREVELSADVIENGRYGLDVLNRELSQAGFYGTLTKAVGATSNATIMCSGTAAGDLVLWADSLPFHAVGLRSSALANVDADPACLARKAGTDAIFVQRASSCNSAECGPENGARAYLQVSECGTEYSAMAKPFVVAKGNQAALSLKTKACDPTKTAERRELIRRIYYVSPADELSYVDLTPTGASAPVVVVENIEQLQFSYGVDSDDDGSVDSFSSSPADWTKVIGARVWLLAKSAEASANTKAAATFTLDDTTVAVAAANRNLKRRVYSTYITFATPKARREQ